MDTGNTMADGYWVRARRPRVAGYPDLVEPSRAARIEGIVMDYENMAMDDAGPTVEVDFDDD